MFSLVEKFHDALFLRKFHGIMTIVWGVLIPISILTGLKRSIVWVVLMSAWANFVGHWSAWGAFRAEEAADKENK